MGVPGDIVSALLQGYGARRARLGVAAPGGCRGCLEPKTDAGYARQGGQPRASAQRGSHGPGTDLEPGRDQGQGCPLAKPGPARQQGAGLEPSERLGVPDGYKALVSTLRRYLLLAWLRCSPRSQQSESKPRKQIPHAGDSPCFPAPIRENSLPYPQYVWLALVSLLLLLTCLTGEAEVYAVPLRAGEARSHRSLSLSGQRQHCTGSTSSRD